MNSPIRVSGEGCWQSTYLILTGLQVSDGERETGVRDLFNGVSKAPGLKNARRTRANHQSTSLWRQFISLLKDLYSIIIRCNQISAGSLLPWIWWPSLAKQHAAARPPRPAPTMRIFIFPSVGFSGILWLWPQNPIHKKAEQMEECEFYGEDSDWWFPGWRLSLDPHKRALDAWSHPTNPEKLKWNASRIIQGFHLAALSNSSLWLDVNLSIV